MCLFDFIFLNSHKQCLNNLCGVVPLHYTVCSHVQKCKSAKVHIEASCCDTEGDLQSMDCSRAAYELEKKQNKPDERSKLSTKLTD